MPTYLFRALSPRPAPARRPSSSAPVTAVPALPTPPAAAADATTPAHQPEKKLTSTVTAAAAAASATTTAPVPAATSSAARTRRKRFVRATPAAIMDSGASHQIRQMANFILQEAHEKANEIKIKTEHDFNLEKQMIVHSAKLKIQEEYAQKEKDREIQDRM